MKHFDKLDHQAIEFHRELTELNNLTPLQKADLERQEQETKRQAELEMLKNSPEAREFIDEVFIMATEAIDAYTDGDGYYFKEIRPEPWEEPEKLVKKGILRRKTLVPLELSEDEWEERSRSSFKSPWRSVVVQTKPRTESTWDHDAHLRAQRLLVFETPEQWVKDEIVGFMAHYGYEEFDDYEGPYAKSSIAFNLTKTNEAE